MLFNPYILQYILYIIMKIDTELLISWASWYVADILALLNIC